MEEIDTAQSLPLQKGAALVRLALGALALAGFLVALFFADHVRLWNSGVLWVGLFTLKAGIEFFRPSYGRAVAYWSPALDIMLLTLWLWSFTSLYGGTPAATFKAPGFAYYFLLILGAAVWRRPLPVLFAGGLAAGAWLMVIVASYNHGSGVTLSYTYAMRSFELMPVVEMEKLLALVSFSGLLALFIHYLKSERASFKPAPEATLSIDETSLSTPIISDGDIITVMADPDVQPAPEMVGRPVRVMLAEDNGVNRMVLEKILSDRGMNVTACDDGEELTKAFQLAKEAGSLPDMVLLDLDMPIMGGIETAHWLRAFEAREGVPRTPILTVTAQTAEGIRESCQKAGMDGYLAKPVTRETLFAAMVSAMITSNGKKS